MIVYRNEYSWPTDHDTFSITIEPRKGPGHYMVAWGWNGYYDCTDVDVFDYEVENIYGVKNEGFVWNRIDHCQYKQFQYVDSPCFEVSLSI